MHVSSASVPWWARCAVFLAVGCGNPAGPGPADGGGSSSTQGEPTNSSTGLDGTGSTSSATGDSTGEPYSCEHPVGLETCDLSQGSGCEPGSHCVPEIVGEVFDEALGHCFPIVEPPLPRGADCSPDPETCNDACDRGSFCHPQVGADQGRVCVSSCYVGDDYLPSIDGGCAEEELCVPSDSGTGVSLCWPKCNPLDSQCPAGASACVQVSEHRMVCQPTGYGSGGLGEACGGMLSCQEGTVCQEQAYLGPECRGPSCCTELCDLSDGEPGCSSVEHECLPYHLPGDTPAGSENLGFCGLPSAHPCLSHPGACPPADADQTYPWCSLVATTGCERGLYYAVYDDFGCTTECSCTVPCEDASQCPIPATGTAIPECVPTGIEGQNTCVLPCGGVTCPDGMACGDAMSSICTWTSPLAIPQCVH
ncbi:MAG: hypothetical protein AB1Z98_19740 [Nannocystaceae bacterium]